jgi:tetratricopeptide (TPR) repeat protein
LLQWANRLQQEGHYEDALSAYERAIALAPEDADLLYVVKADLLGDLQRDQEALVAYAQALRLNPHLAVAYSNLGVLLYHMQHVEEAIRAFEQAIALEPAEVKYYHNLCEVLEQLGRWREAMLIQFKAEALGLAWEGKTNPSTPLPEEEALAWEAFPTVRYPTPILLKS